MSYPNKFDLRRQSELHKACVELRRLCEGKGEDMSQEPTPKALRGDMFMLDLCRAFGVSTDWITNVRLEADAENVVRLTVTQVCTEAGGQHLQKVLKNYAFIPEYSERKS